MEPGDTPYPPADKPAATEHQLRTGWAGDCRVAGLVEPASHIAYSSAREAWPFQSDWDKLAGHALDNMHACSGLRTSIAILELFQPTLVSLDALR